MLKITVIFFILFTYSCDSKSPIPNNWTLTNDRQFVLQEEDNQLITDIAKFKAFENGTISIVSSKDGSCKLYDTTGKLLWHYLPDWKLIDTFLAVVADNKKNYNPNWKIMNSEELIERQKELHGDIDENIWSRFMGYYKHSVENVAYNHELGFYLINIKVHMNGSELENNKTNYFSAYNPLILKISDDFQVLEYLPIINFTIDSTNYTIIRNDMVSTTDNSGDVLNYTTCNASYHPVYSKIDPSKVDFYSITAIDIKSNMKSYGAKLPDKNIKNKVFLNFSFPLFSLDTKKELWYLFPLNDTLYNYHTNKILPLQLEINNDEFYNNFADESDYLTKAKRLNFIIEDLSISNDNDILIFAVFPKRDGNNFGGTSLVQTYNQEGKLNKHYRFKDDKFDNKKVHGIVSNPSSENEVVVITNDDDNYYLNYCKWVEVK
ncbi:MAG: hypothetical protein KGZ71_10030 [Desulfobulbaceae bacterium]|nr:hypothetical protein [Desulfobulbaceae bacterium]